MVLDLHRILICAVNAEDLSLAEGQALTQTAAAREAWGRNHCGVKRKCAELDETLQASNVSEKLQLISFVACPQVSVLDHWLHKIRPDQACMEVLA